ncbi:MAG: hypothetical protein ABI444_13555 [Candidatus Kapaibacterium sp.]|jgi:hypothetical protein
MPINLKLLLLTARPDGTRPDSFGGSLFIFIILVVYLGFCLIPTRMAKKKGRSAFGLFVLAVFFTPIVALIVILLLAPIEKK